ncbi:MAG TPA: GIY-YIG nuclease family protein [Polyangiaceae bacterium]
MDRSPELANLVVLALDCQASGASPAYGDVLELGFARVGAIGLEGRVESRWIVPRTTRRIGRAVRELTGWSEACLAEAIDEGTAWRELTAMARSVAAAPERGAPTVIHFARFELAFFRDLHARLAPDSPFPFDAVCLHAVSQRLYPDLPRKSIRALAGYLGHSPELVRRSLGHVEATAFIWRALVPELAAAGLTTWEELRSWLAEPARVQRSSRRSFPLAPERRRSLPDASGVYRFLRRNGDVVYVGKAASLKKRVASHFKSRGPATERGLELLTQVHDIDHTETPSVVEAALLECDEIKRLDPPYNVQLRAGERSAWFASRDFCEAVSAPDEVHRVGPLPSERALSPLGAAISLLAGAEPAPGLRATALAVPAVFTPEEALFREGWNAFVAEHVPGSAESPSARLLAASRALFLARGRAEPDPGPEDRAPDEWDLARVRRRLERNLVQTGLLLRRARFLCLLVDANVAFREPERTSVRALTIAHGQIVDRRELATVLDVASLRASRPRPLLERKRAFDSAAAYDRLRTLLTELRRVRAEGGEIALAVGGHLFAGERLAEATRDI